MELLTDINEVLSILNRIKQEKRISLDKISSDIKKDKTVTSRILNGKYNLDLLTFINICKSLDVDPSFILDSILNPKIKRIPITDKEQYMFENMLKLINDYVKK